MILCLLFYGLSSFLTSFNIICLYFFLLYFFALLYFSIDTNLFYFVSMLYREKLRTTLGMVEIDWWIVLIGLLEILL